MDVIEYLMYLDADKSELRPMKNWKEQIAEWMITDTKTRFAFHNLWNAA